MKKMKYILTLLLAFMLPVWLFVVNTEAAPICEVREIKTPVAGHFPDGLFKYPYRANSTINNGFTQTLTWTPAIESTFQVNTEYTVTLTLEPNISWVSSGMPGSTRSFSANNITPTDIVGLPSVGVKTMTWEYIGSNLLIHITFHATAATESASEIIFYEDFSRGVHNDNTIGEGAFMLGPEQERTALGNWRDDMTTVRQRADGASELVLGYRKNSSGAPSGASTYERNNFITSGAVRTYGRASFQGGGAYNLDDLIFENAFGYYEANIKFPQENAVWGAFWLFTPLLIDPLPIVDGGSIYATEIDIIESAGFHAKSIQAAYHAYRSSSDRNPTTGLRRDQSRTLLFPGDAGWASATPMAATEAVGIQTDALTTGIDIYDGEFHRLGLEWSPTDYKFYVDGILFGSWKNESSHVHHGSASYSDWPLIRQNEGVMQNPAYMKLSVEAAAWADSTGLGIDSSHGEMVVDYVAVWNGKRPSQIAIPNPPTPPSQGTAGTGKITVHKLERNTQGIADPDNIYSGKELSPTVVEALGTPLDGAGFTLYEMNMSAVDAHLIANPLVTITGHSVAGLVVTYTFSDSTSIPIIATAFVEGAEQFTGTVVPGSGQLTFGNNDLADGYYLLVETTPPGIQYTAAEPSVIRMPLTLSNGLVNRDIHVYPKNINANVPVVEKKMRGTPIPVNTNAIVPFQITSLFKNNITTPVVDVIASVEDLYDSVTGSYGTFVVTDSLESYFSYVDTGTTPAGSNLVVYLVDCVGAQIGTALTETEYILGGVTLGSIGQGAMISIALTPAGIDVARAANAVGLVVEFDAQYTGGASTGASVTTISNRANVVMTTPNGTDPPPTIPPSVLEVPTAGITVDKVTDGGAPLQGAVFALATGPSVSIIYDHTGTTTYSGSDLITLASEYVVDVVTGLPIVGTTGPSGELTFNNVPYTDAGITYYLRELETLAGYELPVGHIEVILEGKADLSNAPEQDVAGNWINGAKIQRSVTIVNDPLGTNRSFHLPLTGGSATTLFTVVGIVVMLGTAMLYLREKNA